MSKFFKSHCKELLLVTLLFISAFIQNLEKYLPLLEVRIFKQNHYFIAKGQQIIKKNNYYWYMCLNVRLRFKYNNK